MWNFFLFTLCLYLFSCSPHERDSAQIDLSSIPLSVPEQIFQADHVDSVYFQYLAPRSLSDSEGNIVLNDWDSPFVLKLNRNGDLIEVIGRKGSGPGEIQRAGSTAFDKERNLFIFDVVRSRIIKLSNEFDLVQEFEPPILDNMQRVTEVYATSADSLLLLKITSGLFLRAQNEKPKTIFALWNLETGSFEQKAEYPAKAYARLFVDGNMRGATQVPFSGDLLYDTSPDKQSLFVYWSEDNHITELDVITFDTLRTIDIQLPKESVSSSEIDSLKELYRPEQWRTLRKILPAEKALAEDMIIDQKGRFWMKLNNIGNHQEWLVLNRDGTPEKIVQLPKEGSISHVSEYHIGFRNNETNFTLFEAVK